MKKLLLFVITICSIQTGFAQKATKCHHAEPLNTYTAAGTRTYAKTETIGDTVTLSNIPSADTPYVLYTAGTNDSGGYLTGTDKYNDVQFAERYDFNGADSNVIILGVFAQFGGVVNPASAQTVTFYAWDQGAPVVITSGLSYNGFPNSILDSVVVPVTRLGIGTSSDTLKSFLFPVPTPQQYSSFFVGYGINYNFNALNGDTIGLASSLDGDRTSYYDTALLSLGSTAYDTIINVQNATMQSDYNWYDNYSQNDSLYNDLAIFPIVRIISLDNVKGVTKNNFTFYGNYPNPCINSTNIKFSLAEDADVTIQVMDMAGHMISTVSEANISSGIHSIPVSTAQLAAGDYLYLVRTSYGGGMAGKFTVIR